MDEPQPARWSVWGAFTGWFESERESWFNWVPVCLGLGAAFYFWLPVEPSASAAFTPVACAGVLKLLWRRNMVPFVLASIIFWFAAGLALSKLRTEWLRAPVLEKQLNHVEVAGFVELVEPKAGRGQRLTLRVTRIAGVAEDKLPRRVRVRTLVSLVGLRPGDAVRIRATLGPPGEPSLPGGFDFGRQAWYLAIGGVGYALQAATIDPGAGPLPQVLWFKAGVETVRLAIGRAVVAALPGETGGIANALITGERGGISAATDSVYRDSGLYHFLSISGLHMVVMAGALFFAVRFALAAVPGIALRYPIKKWAAFAAMFGALGYLLISGSSFATLRSYVQISIVFAAIMAERPALALRNVALAALGMLIVWPESLLDAGFQMSFAAVVALIAGYEALHRRQERLGRADVDRGPVRSVSLFLGGILLSTLMATAAVAPIAAYHFHTSQQYGMLANLLALPICDLIVMPMALAALLAMPLGLEAWPLWVMGLGIDAMTAIAARVSQLSGAVIAVVAIPLMSLVWMVAGGLWLLLWRTRARLLGLPVFLVGVALAPLLKQPDILVGRDGKLVAARTDGKRLAALPAPRGVYELSRWLEADGDTRPAKTVATGDGFGCDGASCTAMVAGQRIAVTRHASALRDDCARANILVLGMARPKGCTKPLLVIDPAATRRGGAHAITVVDGVIRVATVAELRGERPWSRPPPVAPPVRGAGGVPLPRLTQFAIQAALALGGDLPRPEDEGDDLAAIPEGAAAGAASDPEEP